MQDEHVDYDERLKAAFLSEYRELCHKHKMMVIMATRNKCQTFVVAEISNAQAQLDRSISEMLMDDLVDMVE